MPNSILDQAKAQVNADRCTLWLIDTESNELWTKIPVAGGALQTIRLPRDAGFVGQVAMTGEPFLIPFDLYTHPDTQRIQDTDRQTGYRTCSLLCMPLFNANHALIAVIQFVNKINPGQHPPYDPASYPAAPACWQASFSPADQAAIAVFNTQISARLAHLETLFEP